KPYVSKATGYKLKTLPSFFQMLKKTFLDYYPTHYPIFHEYEKKRRRALIHYYNKLKDSIADRRFDMQQGIELARKLIHEGKTTATIVKELMKKGVPRSTAYRWVSAARNGA
ncbi:MAG: hypothetical protein F7B78_05550, partial [Desulfurococcales archaeon]|nr:hypothetical protein [Desulfurococcales archaeon]